MKRIIITLLCITFSLCLHAQDTLRVMYIKSQALPKERVRCLFLTSKGDSIFLFSRTNYQIGKNYQIVSKKTERKIEGKKAKKAEIK